MKHLIEFKLADGSSMFVESDNPPDSKQRVGRIQEGIEESERQFTQAIASLRPAAEAILKAFQEITMPDEIDLEFGIKLDAKAGAIFTSIGAEATFKVSLKWSNKK